MLSTFITCRNCFLIFVYALLKFQFHKFLFQKICIQYLLSPQIMSCQYIFFYKDFSLWELYEYVPINVQRVWKMFWTYWWSQLWTSRHRSEAQELRRSEDQKIRSSGHLELHQVLSRTELYLTSYIANYLQNT